MAQAQNKVATPAAEKNAPAAPVAGAPATDKATPAAKVSRKIVAGPALDRLIAAGASLVPLPSKGKLHSTVTSQLGASIRASDLAKRCEPLTKSWEQFDRGYLVGPAASYSACAVNNGSKKAKATPAFVWARRTKDGVELFTADGQPWPRPAKGEREQGVYDAALKQATEALPKAA